MIKRILLAVHDSPDSLAAARVAIELADRLPAHLRAVHVRADPALNRELQESTSRSAVAQRQERAAAALLARVAALGAAAGITIQPELLTGEVAQAILDAARGWPADLVVIGKSRRAAAGEPYVGSETRSVLEFGEQPVLVVPARQPAFHSHIDTDRPGRPGSPGHVW